MSRDIAWTRPALKDLERLDRQSRDRVASALAAFGEDGSGDVRRLVDVQPARYRLRVGSLRVIFTQTHPNYPSGAIVILRVLPRDKAYR